MESAPDVVRRLFENSPSNRPDLDLPLGGHFMLSSARHGEGFRGGVLRGERSGMGDRAGSGGVGSSSPALSSTGSDFCS